MLVLVAGVLHVLEEDTAVIVALWVAVAQLATWGVLCAGRQQWSWLASVVTGAVDAAFGVAIIVLKAFLH